MKELLIILVVIVFIIIGLAYAIPEAIEEEAKQIEESTKETDKDIFKWYKSKLKLIKRSRGMVYRSLIMGLYLHKGK